MNLLLFDWKKRIKAAFSAYMLVFLLFLFGCFSSVTIPQHWSAYTYVKKRVLTHAKCFIIPNETVSMPYTLIILPIVIVIWRVSSSYLILLFDLTFPQISVKVQSFLHLGMDHLLYSIHQLLYKICHVMNYVVNLWFFMTTFCNDVH